MFGIGFGFGVQKTGVPVPATSPLKNTEDKEQYSPEKKKKQEKEEIGEKIIIEIM